MKAFGKIIFGACIVVVLIVFVQKIGNVLAFNGRDMETGYSVPSSGSVVNKERYPLEEEILGAMDKAREAAYALASDGLDAWISEMMTRADEEFLDGYYNIMQAKRRELLSVYHSVKHYLTGLVGIDTKTAEEAALLELEEEISNKIVKPEISQKRLENIMDEVQDVYLETFDSELSKLREKCNLSTLQWNEYIGDLCNLALTADQKRSYPVSVKIAVTSGGALTAMIAAPIVKKVIVKTSARLAENAAAKAATAAGTVAAEKAIAKGAGTAAAKGAGAVARAIPLVGLGITAAICIWDIVDCAKSAEEGKRMFRSSLEDYFAEVKRELLGQGENALMGSLTAWENTLKANIASKR